MAKWRWSREREILQTNEEIEMEGGSEQKKRDSKRKK